MKWSIGKKVGGGFALALLILCFIGGTAYRDIARLLETSELETRSNEVLVLIELTLSHTRAAETGVRGYLISGTEQYLGPWQGADGKITADFDSLRRLTVDDPAQQRRIESAWPLVTEKLSFLKLIQETRRDKSFEAALELLRTDKGEELMEQIQEIFREMRAAEKDLLKARRLAADLAARKTQRTIILGILSGLIILSLAGFLITRDITLPMSQVVSISRRIAGGDLTGKVPEEARSDEIGLLRESFRGMTANLQNQIKKIVEMVNFLAASTSEISAAVAELAASTAETSTAVSQTSATAGEIRQTAQVATQKAKYVADTARQAEQISRDGLKAVDVTLEGMNGIRAQMESIGGSIMRLSEQSQAIGEIIAVVDDIADQTNLLAVNAAIEAAKAEEHGKGFSVVAQEIRSLAEQSKQATTRVRTILGEIRKATSDAVLATEQGSKRVEAGVKQSAQAGESIKALADSVAEAAQAGVQITASSQQQVAGTDQVAAAMENVKQAIGQNTVSTRQLETMVQKLAELGRDLKNLVDYYQVG